MRSISQKLEENSVYGTNHWHIKSLRVSTCQCKGRNLFSLVKKLSSVSSQITTLAALCEAWGRGGKVSNCYIPLDHFISHVVVISDDTDESLAEETQKVKFILRLTALFMAENVQMETKHSLAHTQNYRMH